MTADPHRTPDPPAQVAGFPLPAELARSTDPELCAWRAELPEIVSALLQAWSLTPLPPFEPGGSCSWVAPVRDRDGRELALKVTWTHDDGRDEAVGMQLWQEHGAARVLRSEVHGDTTVLLMEQVRPGTTLAASLPWPARDEVVASLLTRLWAAPVPDPVPLRPLAGMCERWAEEARRRLLPVGADHARLMLPRELIEQGLSLFAELPRTWDGPPRPLATDLHHENVLACDGPDGRRWVLIDPKPYVGDPHYDVLQHMLNDPERLSASPAAFGERMAQLTGLDTERVLRWLLARCVQETYQPDGATAIAAQRLAADGIA